ncbi:MAG: hypothetical protein AB1521_16385 [Bacteroidota bacterium]
MRNKKEIKELALRSEQTAADSKSCCDSTCCGSSSGKEKSKQSNPANVQPVNKRGK